MTQRDPRDPAVTADTALATRSKEPSDAIPLATWKQLLEAPPLDPTNPAAPAPPSVNGASDHDPVATGDRVRRFLDQLADPHFRLNLPGFTTPSQHLQDTQLDPAQQWTVLRALASPDLFLLAGPPGTGKTRVCLEVIRQCLAQGEKVLYLAGYPSSLDQVLSALTQEPAVFQLRCLGRDEPVEQLSAASQRFIWPVLNAELPGRLEASIDAQIVELMREHQCLHQFDALMQQGLEVIATQRNAANDLQDIAADRKEVETRLTARLAEVLTCEATEPLHPHDQKLRIAQDHSSAEQDRLNRSRREAEVKQAEWQRQAAELTCKLEELRSTQQRRREAGLFSGEFWKRLVAGDGAASVTELETQLAQLETQIVSLDEELQRRSAEQTLAAQTWTAAQDAWAQTEQQHQLETIQRKEDRCQSIQAQAQQDWQLLSRQLESLGFTQLPEVLDPRALTRLETQRSERQCRLQEQRSQLEACRQRVHAQPKAVCERYRQHINLVVGSISSPLSDPYFGDATVRDRGFDLLIVDDARELTDSEFMQAARLARRWLLIADETLETLDEMLLEVPTAGSNPGRESGRSRGPSRGSRGTPRTRTRVNATIMARLWQSLHLDYWGHEPDGRLCCRLHRLLPEQRGALETESVADHPEIELRIFTSEGGDPLLAEVVFPGSMPLAEAKAFLFRELGELTIAAPAMSTHWQVVNTGLMYELYPCDHRNVNRIELEPGVWEWVHGPERNRRLTSHTCRLEFDLAQGWDRARAEAWLEEQAGNWKRRRASRLTTLYQQAPGLVRLCRELIERPDWSYPEGRSPGPSSSVFEFVPVPPQQGRRGEIVIPRVGAGLECDLRHGPSRDQLPDELKRLLPRQGYVNLEEAKILLDQLEALLAAGAKGIGVTATFSTQVQVLRHSLKARPSLAAQAERFTLLPPMELLGRPVEILLMGLTRSHPAHAVPHAEKPTLPFQLMCQARRRLILVGDPGGLNRRSTWQGSLDFFDERQALLERTWIQGLIQQLRGQHSSPRSDQRRHNRRR